MPAFKTCKFAAEAIVTEGIELGAARKVCTNPACPVHHPSQKNEPRMDAQWKAAQEKWRLEETIANATGQRVLAAIGSAIPVRLLKRDLAFVLEQLIGALDQRQLETIARQRGIRVKKEDGEIAKVLIAFVRRTDEGTLSRMVVEAAIVAAISRHGNTASLQRGAYVYKIDVEAISLKVKQDLEAKAQPKPAVGKNRKKTA